MKQAILIDENGFKRDVIMVDDNSENASDIIVTPVPTGFYEYKWNGTEWVEGLTEEELNIIKNTPLPKSELEIAQDTINSLGMQLFEAQTQILQAESDKVMLGQQLFSLQTQLMTKGVL